MTLKILSGGAAHGLVSALTPAFTQATGMDLDGDFGAVGGMKERFLGGEKVDVLILTRTIIDALAAEGKVDAATVADLGDVVAGMAQREGASPVDVSSEDALRATLLAADAIYFPDPDKATAGIHFARVLKALGVYEKVADRLRLFPNGQTAMAAMAKGSDKNPIGSTQITEILNTAGVTYAGDLPGTHRLVTTYTGAVTSAAKQAEAGRTLIDILTGADAEQTRRAKGFAG